MSLDSLPGTMTQTETLKCIHFYQGCSLRELFSDMTDLIGFSYFFSISQCCQM